MSCSRRPSGTPRADDQPRLIAALRDPRRLGAATGTISLVETHISYVLLTDRYAYKIKKNVRFPFLDFSTLEKRRFYCDEELRLNRRLAPALYLDVVAITGTPDEPAIGGDGPVLEYAVRMRRFPDGALLSDLIAREALFEQHVDALALAVARFHATAPRAGVDTPFGTPDEVLRPALANIEALRPRCPKHAAALAALEGWTRAEHTRLRTTFDARRAGGFVRECHGDLHLGNVTVIEGELAIFDCIEFDERMRWIDVMSEIAFTAMDLDHRGRADLAHRFVNDYFEHTGDYDGGGVLRFYRVYRALVRAKVAALRAAGLPDGTRDHAAASAESVAYLDLASRMIDPPSPAIVITHGLSGCGKTTVSQALLERLGAIRVRSDVERKRMHGLGARQSSRSGIAGELYAPDATRETYTRLAALARTLVVGGAVALIDAAFLQRWQRDIFRDLAAELDVPFAIVDIRASLALLRERLERRATGGNDASEANAAVLDYQLRTSDPLGCDEQGDIVGYDGDPPPAPSLFDAAARRLQLHVRAGALRSARRSSQKRAITQEASS